MLTGFVAAGVPVSPSLAAGVPPHDEHDDIEDLDGPIGVEVRGGARRVPDVDERDGIEHVDAAVAVNISFTRNKRRRHLTAAIERYGSSAISADKALLAESYWPGRRVSPGR